MTIYRGMNRSELDAVYDNSLAVADSARLLADFDLRSEQLRRERATALDLRYGRAPRNRLDYFAGAPGAPLVVCIHGGYWQMRAKESFSFVAAGPLAHGLHVAVIGYTLAPETSLAGIVSEVRSALAWLAERAPGYGAAGQRIYVAGWSAGGHLTAMCLRESAVRGGMAVSGIFDLEPVRLAGDIAELRRLVTRHALFTKSRTAQRILDQWEAHLPRFVKVFPMEYRRVLGQMMREDEVTEREEVVNG